MFLRQIFATHYLLKNSCIINKCNNSIIFNLQTAKKIFMDFVNSMIVIELALEGK